MFGVALDMQELIALAVGDLSAADAAKGADGRRLGRAFDLQGRAGCRSDRRREARTRDRGGGSEAGSLQEVTPRRVGGQAGFAPIRFLASFLFVGVGVANDEGPRGRGVLGRISDDALDILS
jgi:hypothetical protein